MRALLADGNGQGLCRAEGRCQQEWQQDKKRQFAHGTVLLSVVGQGFAALLGLFLHDVACQHLPLGIAGAAIIAATYVIPWLRRVWTRHLDRLADAEGTSRAEIIRRLIDRALDTGADRRNLLLAAIDASAGAAPELSVPARAGSEREQWLERLRQDTV